MVYVDAVQIVERGHVSGNAVQLEGTPHPMLFLATKGHVLLHGLVVGYLRVDSKKLK